MSRWPRSLCVLAILCSLCCGAATGVAETSADYTMRRLKQQQRETLLREPAERLNELQRASAAWEAMARASTGGQRARPVRVHDDLQSISSSPGAEITPPQAVSVPPNHRLNDPTGEPFGACQSEVSIASRSNNVLAAWNDGIGIYGPPFPEDTQGYGYSSDGGITWTDGGPPPNGGAFIWSSDPVVVVDEKTGDFFYCALVDMPGQNGIAVMKGTFNGNAFAWQSAKLVRAVANTAAFLDKPWLAVDSLSGNLYLSYTEFTAVGGQLVSDQIRLQRSTDGNATWQSPTTLSATADAGLVQGSRPAVGPDGELYVVWHAIGQPSGPNANSPFGRDFLRSRKSTDAGQSFGAEVTADSLFSNFSSGAPGFNRGIGITFPGIAVDRSNGPRRGRVYVTWNESLNFYNDPFPDPVSDPARSEIENNNGSANATAFTPGEVLRGTISITGNPGDLDYWKWNANQGQTTIFYLDSLASGLDAAFRIFCSDGSTLLAFSQNGVGGRGLLVFTAPTTATYFMRMASYTGTTTGRYRVLTTTNFPQGDRARDHRDIFIKSSANGTTWGPTVRVNDSPGYFDDWLPEAQVDGTGRVFVACYDWRDAAGICGGGSNPYLYRSDDGGANWQPGTRISDTTTNWTVTYSTLLPNQGDYLGLFAGDSTVYVAWADGRAGDPDAYVATATSSTSCLASPACLVDTTIARTQIVVTWSAPSGFTAELLRRTGSGPYVDLGPVTANGSNQIVYTDNTVLPGADYTYTLSAPGYCSPLMGTVLATPLCDQAPVALASSSVASDTITVIWSAPQGLQATLFRRVGAGAFVDLGTVTADANNQIVYVDIGVSGGQSYTYRLGLQGFCQAFAGQVTLVVPGAAFGISGIRPNPTPGDVVVAFSIDPLQPATLELLDITGRQIQKTSVTCSSNPCVVNMTQGARIKSGLYFVRLSQAGHESVKRVSVFP